MTERVEKKAAVTGAGRCHGAVRDQAAITVCTNAQSPLRDH
jgi:hypothetical protein